MVVADWLGIGTPNEVLAGSGVVLVVVALLVLRFIQKLVLRLVLVGVLVVVAVGVYANRDQLGECTSTCSCRLFDRQVDMPLCD